MGKKVILTTVVFLAVGAMVFAAVALTSSQEITLPEQITPETPCPVASCTQPNGGCHAGSPEPEVDGSFLMICPKVDGCTSTECHAYDRLTTHYNAPSDFALNLWILAPVVLVMLLVMIVKKVA